MKDKTVAVLPFVNMSSSEENEFFSDGITEEIINALAKVENLKVTSRTSSFFFKWKNEPISKIGYKLKVSTILEDSVRLSGNELRITAQLIQVKNDFHFWSETWDRKLENIFEIQDGISLLVADKLREHLVNPQTENVTAYKYCLKAKFCVNKWNPEDAKTAISYYEKSLTLDTNYSEAYLGLAGSYSFQALQGLCPLKRRGEKQLNTRRAHQLNNSSCGVHPNQLSWLLNENLGKNFNEFINHYRIAAFKTIAKDPKNANITILGLAYDCGFNSKTVFNTYFKKETGQTPKQFLNQQG